MAETGPVTTPRWRLSSQRIVTIQRFDEPALLDDGEDASEEIPRRVQALPISREEES